VYVVCVNILVKPGLGDAYAEVLRKNHEGSVQEAGCLRFDVLRQTPPPAEGEPEKFFIYEVYTSEDAFKAHQTTEHYFRFREEAEGLQEGLRQGVKYESVFPKEWK